jgi:hypothetical protein
MIFALLEFKSIPIASVQNRWMAEKGSPAKLLKSSLNVVTSEQAIKTGTPQ